MFCKRALLILCRGLNKYKLFFIEKKLRERFNKKKIRQKF